MSNTPRFLLTKVCLAVAIFVLPFTGFVIPSSVTGRVYASSLMAEIKRNLTGQIESIFTDDSTANVQLAPLGLTPVFSDDFSSHTNAAYSTSGPLGSSSFALNRSGADWGGRRNTAPAQLELTNDVSTANNANGWVFANVPTTTFASPYTPVLANNPAMVTWTFNMRQIRDDPAGFSGNSTYGAAFILATNTTAPDVDFGKNGYAVILGESGTIDRVRLVKFTNGLQSSVPETLVSSTTTGLNDFGAQHLSVKVTYTPGTNSWELYVRNDGAAFSDPAIGTLTYQGADVDNTYTGVSLGFMGAYWQGATATNQTAFFDNVTVSVTQPSIVVSETGLSDFGSVSVGSVSPEKTYTVSGTDLNNSIVVTVPSPDFQVSTTSGSGFGSRRGSSGGAGRGYSPVACGMSARSAPLGMHRRAKVSSNSTLKLNFHSASSMITKQTDSTAATESAWIPVANPTPMEQKM